MTRFQKLAATTLGTAILLVTIGVIVRATDSGVACPDWPLCYGQLLPPAGDVKAWIEWTHRTVAAVIGFEILGLAILAWLDHRDRRSLVWPSIGAVGLVGFQASFQVPAFSTFPASTASAHFAMSATVEISAPAA